jgi:murein L,D-transpeptidase YafK
VRKVPVPLLALGLLLLLNPPALAANGLPSSPEAAAVRARETPILSAEMAKKGLALGSSVYIAIYKHERELEVWAQPAPDKRYVLFKSYPICKFSGYIGPKLMSGDDQSPEGFYRVTPDALNARSHYHLAFDIGYPNAYDRDHGRTGSHIMVHGDCKSIGCYAMTNAGIDEIYTLVYSALASGEPNVPVAIYPFRMTQNNMELHSLSPWAGFWRNLKAGYDAFQATGRPPYVAVVAGRYDVTANTGAAAATTTTTTTAAAADAAVPTASSTPPIGTESVPAASASADGVAVPPQSIPRQAKN